MRISIYALRRKAVQDGRRKTRFDSSSRRQRQLVVRLTVNMTVFAVLWTPLAVVYVVDCALDPSSSMPTVWLVASTMAKMFSGVGWITHGLWNEQLRRCVRSWCASATRCCCARRGRDVRMTSIRSRFVAAANAQVAPIETV